MDEHLPVSSRPDQKRALISSTLAFTVCFATWTIFSIIGVKIAQNLGLNDAEFGLLIATPILMGSVSRIFLGIWTDQFGGRIVFTLVMVVAAIFAWLLTYAHTFEFYLVIALGLGLSGGSFAVGIAYVSRWYPREKQGTALGIFGVGNVGAAVTNFCAPFLLVAIGWQGVAKVYALVMLLVAIIFWFVTKTDPAVAQRKAKKMARPSTLEELTPLKKLQVCVSLYIISLFLVPLLL